MGMRITFELTDRDLGFFRKALRQSRAAVKDAEDAEIIDAIHAVLDEIRSSGTLRSSWSLSANVHRIVSAIRPTTNRGWDEAFMIPQT